MLHLPHERTVSLFQTVLGITITDDETSHFFKALQRMKYLSGLGDSGVDSVFLHIEGCTPEAVHSLQHMVKLWSGKHHCFALKVFI